MDRLESYRATDFDAAAFSLGLSLRRHRLSLYRVTGFVQGEESLSGTEVEDAPTGQKIIISREVKPIKHRRLAAKFFDWFTHPPKKSPDERRLKA